MVSLSTKSLKITPKVKAEYSFNSLTSLVSLHNAWKAVRGKNSAGGIDGVSVAEFEQNLMDNLTELRYELITKTWNPEPYLRISIAKNETERRKLGLLTIKDKIVQQAIKMAIEPRMETLFLPNSFGYRPEKGPERAVRKMKQELLRFKLGYVAKLDVDDFFDTVNHELLLNKLSLFLKDKNLLRLIELCIKAGNVNSKLKWNESKQGLPQGAVLSPLLANFYLHSFDQFVVKMVRGYVRYADDFVIITKSKEEIEEVIKKIEKELEDNLLLKLNKPVINNIHEGVEFLGISVSATGLSLSAKKKKDIQQKIGSIEFTKYALSAKSLETLQGLKNYYAKLLPQDILQECDMVLMNRLEALVKKNCNSIPSKKILLESLGNMEFFSLNSNLRKNQLMQQLANTYLIHKGKKQKKPEKVRTNQKLIADKKREYQKLENANSELVVSTPGSYIGATYKGITVKLKSKVLNQPSAALKHITVIGKGVSISSNALMYCMEHKIPIDFFDSKGKQYASVLTPIFVEDALWSKQVELPLERRVKLASSIVYGKLKNQQNLIKYYYKYHKGVLDHLPESYADAMLRLDKVIKEVKLFDEISEDYSVSLMALESQGAVAYWAYIRDLIIDDDVGFVRREHQGATDLFNSMLNYGYAILYARVWKKILAAKLNPSIGVLHAQQSGKPTLVFDVVEIFRSQAVDRVVISLIQKKTALEVSEGMLTDSTKRALIRAILERLNRYEKFRGEEITLDQIILKQARDIAAYIKGDKKTFKPYIAKW